MKKLVFLMMASALLYACSNNDDPLPDAENQDGSVTFELATVNELTNGMNARADLYSQEATQHITRVQVHAFLKGADDQYAFAKTYDITGWTDGTTLKRFAIPDDNKLTEGTYKFLAVGRDATDHYNVDDPGTTHYYQDMGVTVDANGNESEIFAGSADAVIEKGTRVSIQMIRKVAGVLGYFKNVPEMVGSNTVKSIRLIATDANTRVNLTTGIGVSTETTPYTVLNISLDGQTVSNGVYTGVDMSGQGVDKVPNSQLAGAFMIPVGSIKLTLGLYDESGIKLKEWTVKDGNSDTFSILANHFYSLGIKAQTGNTNGGTTDPGDDDAPIDLLTDQSIVITVSPAWELIHELIIQ